MTTEIQHNQPCQTPNGPGLVFQEWENLKDRNNRYIMVRHAKGVDIDLGLVTEKFSKSSRPLGWLVAYPMDQVTGIT